MRCPDASTYFELEAKSEGPWINNFFVQPTYTNIDPLSTTDFNLVFERHAGSTGGSQPPTALLEREIHYNLSMIPGASRFVGDILERDSEWLRVAANWLSNMPAVRPIQTQVNFDWFTGEESGVMNDSLYLGSASSHTGIYALDLADHFDILCIPPMTLSTVGGTNNDIGISTWQAALAYCKKRRAVLIVDPFAAWTSVSAVTNASTGIDGTTGTGMSSLRDENAVFYFPRINALNTVVGNAPGQFAACGAVAGMIARTDATRGRWKAPAGLDARLSGVLSPVVSLTDGEVGQLNPLGVNEIRTMPAAGNVVWGARTLEGADRLSSDWKYLPVRRMALYIEESLYKGTQWVVFEPNDASLWGQIRLSVGSFMNDLFRQGAFQGAKPSEAYFVKCDGTTTTQADIDQGIVNIIVGFAPLKPAEFVIIKVQQMTGQIQS
jgi:phage tail sheath protein FI